MSWIDDRIADQKVLEDHKREVGERKRTIAAQAETLYGDLWSEIKEVLKDFLARGLEGFTNGSPLRRVVRRSGKIKPGEQFHPGHEIQIALSEDRQSISITGEFRLFFQLDLCEDAVLCLKTSGKPTSLRDATNMILDRFFFPELQAPPEA